MNRESKFYLAIALLAFFGLCGIVFIRFYDGRTTAKREGVLLDTVVSVEATGKGDTKGALDGAFALIKTLDETFSMYNPGSAVSRINDAAGDHPVKVDQDVLDAVQAAKDVASLSDGAFDPTIGPVTKLWGIGDSTRSLDAVPERATIDRALALVGYRKIELNDSNGTIYLSARGAMLDLGAIAKGFVSQKVAEYLRSEGIESALIDLGGNVQLIGGRPNGEPWRIGIQNPDGKRGEAICAIELRDTAAITAGTYERFVDIGGERYTHIFDPRTGYPVKNNLASVTVVCSNGAEGDALSTALMVIGPDRMGSVRELLSLFPEAEAVFVTRVASGALEVRATKGLEGRVKSLDPSLVVKFIELGR